MAYLLYYLFADSAFPPVRPSAHIPIQLGLILCSTETSQRSLALVLVSTVVEQLLIPEQEGEIVG